VSRTGVHALPLSPLTGSARVSCVGTVSAAKLITDWRTQFGIDITLELGDVSEVGVYRCGDTGLVFFWPPSIAGSARLYAQLQQVDGYYRFGKWEHDFALRQIAPEDGVLEVGCGTGEFLRRVSGVAGRVTGIEISKAAVNEARAHGLDARQASFEEWVGEHPEGASVCCAFQVLEHVTRPREFIESCIRAVRPKGKIIFGTPNAAGYLRHQYDLLDLPPHHMSRWDIGAFRSLQRIFPIRLRRYVIEPVQDWNAELYALSATRAIWARVFPRALVLRVARRLAASKARRFLGGHTICVVFERC
jgi:2-polyprenyl-3-methyl-5-hydroxy-6-metoxy-1,4-benzoquinol methylase